MKWSEEMSKYVFADKSESEIDNLRQISRVLGSQTRAISESGDHTYDEDLQSYDNIVENATNELQAREQALFAKGVRILSSGVRVYPADYQE